MTIYEDEACLYQDADLKLKWCKRGEEAFVDSISPGDQKKIYLYGGVCLEERKAWILIVENGWNNESAAMFLSHLRSELRYRRMDVVWDQAPHHFGEAIAEVMVEKRIYVHLLPPYSPDINPIERLWHWMREFISYNTCWNSLSAVSNALFKFVEHVERHPEEMVSRLGVKSYICNVA